MVLTVFGINHRTSTLAEREPFQLTRQQIGEAVLQYKRLSRVDEVVIVVTCNRIEFYRADRIKGRHGLEVVEFYHQLGIPDPERILPLAYRHVGAGAARHLFRVISGMDSLILGEDQVRNQVKQAYSSACAFGGPGKVLHKLFHHAFRISKQVRSETELGEGARSIPGAAVDLLLSLQPSPQNVLVIGANETTEVIVSSLLRRGIQAMVVNRTDYAAGKMAAAYKAKAEKWQRLPDLVADTGMIFSATGSPTTVVSKEMLQKKTDREVIIADLAVPRDIDPEAGELPGVTLFDLEDLKYHFATISERRCTWLPQAQELIEKQVDEFLGWLHSQSFAGGIEAVKDDLHSAAREELERFLPGFRQSERKGLEAFSHALIKRFLKIARQHFDPDGIIETAGLLKVDPSLIEEPLPIDKSPYNLGNFDSNIPLKEKQ